MTADNIDAPRLPRHIRLPGFVGEEVGLGDVIKRATSSLGIRPCAPCSERAARLNQRIVLSPWRGH
jgi:hypothetical protein